jgi:hypothetical protein
VRADRSTVVRTLDFLRDLLGRKRAKISAVFHAKIEDLTREFEGKLVEIEEVEGSLRAVQGNTSKRSAKEFTKLLRELYKDLRFYTSEEESQMDLFFVNAKHFLLEGIDTNNSLIKNQEDMRVLDEGFNGAFFSLKLIFKASRDGFRPSDFHRLCNGIPNTLNILESEHGKIFGGFTSLVWANSGGWLPDAKAWIFSLTHKTVHRQYKNFNQCVFHSQNECSTFYDFFMEGDCSQTTGTSHFGGTY